MLFIFIYILKYQFNDICVKDNIFLYNLITFKNLAKPYPRNQTR